MAIQERESEQNEKRESLKLSRSEVLAATTKTNGVNIGCFSDGGDHIILDCF